MDPGETGLAHFGCSQDQGPGLFRMCPQRPAQAWRVVKCSVHVCVDEMLLKMTGAAAGPGSAPESAGEISCLGRRWNESGPPGPTDP